MIHSPLPATSVRHARRGSPLLVLVVALAVAVVVWGCGSAGASPSGSDGRIRVVTTTTVFADLVRNVGGDRVTVESLVPAGAEPHTFAPSPSDVRRVSEADVIVMNGLGLDDWLRPLHRRGEAEGRAPRRAGHRPRGRDLPGRGRGGLGCGPRDGGTRRARQPPPLAERRVRPGVRGPDRRHARRGPARRRGRDPRVGGDVPRLPRGPRRLDPRPDLGAPRGPSSHRLLP